MASLGERLRHYRKIAGLTQEEVEGKSGVYDVGALERGEITNPTLQTLERLAETLNISLADLFADNKPDVQELIALYNQHDKKTQKKLLAMIRAYTEE